MIFPMFFTTSPATSGAKEAAPVRAGAAPSRSAAELAAAALQRLRAGRMRAAGAGHDPGPGGGAQGGVLHRDLENLENCDLWKIYG